jgi:hypothetical protein
MFATAVEEPYRRSGDQEIRRSSGSCDVNPDASKEQESLLDA